MTEPSLRIVVRGHGVFVYKSRTEFFAFAFHDGEILARGDEFPTSVFGRINPAADWISLEH